MKRLTSILLALLLAAPCCAQDITTGLVGHWKCQDNAASTVVVGEVGGNMALVGGDNTSVKSGVGPGAALPLCLTLNGTDDVLDTAAESVGTVDLHPDSDNWSIGSWLKTSATSGTYIGKAGATAGLRTIQVFTSVTSTINPSLIIGGGNTVSANGNMSDGVFHHWMLTWDGTTAKIFKDGTDLAATLTPGADPVEAQNIKFGARTNTPAVFLAGSYADIRIYSRALTATDVRRLYVQHYNPVQKILQAQ